MTLNDILSGIGDMVGYMLLSRQPKGMWNEARQGPYDPYNGIMRDVANIVSPLPSKLASIQRQVKGTITPSPTPLPTRMPTPIPNSYEERTMDTFDKQQIPREIAFAIREAEGGKDNSYNLGATDSNPKGGLDYGSPESEATAAAKTLNGTFENDFIGSGKFNTTFKKAFQDYLKHKDSEKFLHDIFLSGYAGKPETWKQRSIDEAKAQGTVGAGEYYDTWDEYVKSRDAWKKWKGKY